MGEGRRGSRWTLQGGHVVPPLTLDQQAKATDGMGVRKALGTVSDDPRGGTEYLGRGRPGGEAPHKEGRSGKPAHDPGCAGPRFGP